MANILPLAVSGPVGYGTKTIALYGQDGAGNIDRTQPATVFLNGVKYENMSASFTDLLMNFCQQFNL